MATKRDRKTAFPFIKPKGSIKKDVQQFRKAVMNENGNDEDVRDAITNPVQRRESSASRFLKHFRPDRNSPAYHSEGKGLRKRRNWASERQLSVDAPSNNNNNNSSAAAAAAAVVVDGQANDRQHPQRSHSFSEPEQPQIGRNKDRDSFRWRLSGKKSEKKLNRAKSESAPSSGHESNPLEAAPAANSNEDQVDGRGAPEGVRQRATDPTYTNAINKQQAQQQQQPAPSFVTGGGGGGQRSKTPEPLEADYVNCEVFAADKRHEPDLLRNLPYQQQIFANRRNRLSASINGGLSEGYGQPIQHRGAAARDALDRPRSLYAHPPPPPSSSSHHAAVVNYVNMQPNGGYLAGPYGRPPAPLPDSAASSLSPTPSSAAAPQSSAGAWHPPAWSDTAAPPDDEETHYASQLRSSMAALLSGHIRQSSSASNASSNFSSYSDEFRSPTAEPGALGLPPAAPYPDYPGYQGAASPPPPPPPVRDASSLKYVKYGPGHEKYPSWPAPHQPNPPPGGSQRSKSWTEQTDYPKEPPAAYARPAARPPGYSQQLKTVMENCERIPPEVYRATDPPPAYNLPPFDCDGRNLDDKDYNIPSPPERDVPRLTYANAEGADYAKYEDIQQYSHSEGYSSYVPSESSYVSVSGTPLLDQLRRDGDTGAAAAAAAAAEPGLRDSISTALSSNSSNETLRWHGSYSDISTTSARHHLSHPAESAAHVVHSAKVQAPQRHNSESVLYYEQQQQQQQQQQPGTNFKTINRMGGWNQRVIERKNQWNSAQTSTSASIARPAVAEEVAVETPAPLSVAERIHQLEWQSKSVPNLAHKPSAPTKSESPPSEKYTYLDPDKRTRVADPTLKAIQKQALLSYYERHKASACHGASGSPPKSSPPPPAALPRTASQSSAASAPPKNDGHSPTGGHASSHSPELHVGSNAAATCANQEASRKSHEAAAPTALPAPSVGGGLVPPERPPKKPHLRPSSSSSLCSSSSSSSSSGVGGGISPDQEMRRIEASAQELINLNRAPMLKRKPPMPDPPSSPPHIVLPPVSPRPDRSATPELPPPPPPPPLDESPPVADDPLPPPPPSAVLDQVAKSPQHSPNSTYHKESYMAHRKLHSPTGYGKKPVDIAESTLTPNSWEKHYNVRQNSAATLIFSSEAEKPIKEAPMANQQVDDEKKEEPAPKHSYRGLVSANAERFAYLRQVSDGRQFGASNGKLSDPGPRSVMTELGHHQRSHSDSDDVVQPPRPAVPAKPAPPPPRPKRPEEVECDQLSKDLMNHLLPSDSRLHALLSAPDPAQTAANLRTEGLLEATPSDAPQSPRSPPPPPPTTPASAPPSLSPNKSNSCAPLPATSAYFTTSEPRAKLLTRYHSNNKLNATSTASETPTPNDAEPLDSELLIKKKEELVSRLARKLDVLRAEREAIQEEVEANEQLGRTVTSRVALLATPTETNKVALHVAEVDKITALLLALAGRLARAENALLSLPADADAQEKTVLEGKRDKLLEQLEEAKRLKENIDRRSRQVSNLLSKYLSDEEFADYTHFVSMKAKLVIDQREIDEKIKLGDEQLAALRETLHARPRAFH